ncbi:hypothetical protein HGA64_00740 [Candidatus Falkowbacteria bacterium]|nr:hypothetical protein [Candidatus Falkowbacteria bacterium]
MAKKSGGRKSSKKAKATAGSPEDFPMVQPDNVDAPVNDIEDNAAGQGENSQENGPENFDVAKLEEKLTELKEQVDLLYKQVSEKDAEFESSISKKAETMAAGEKDPFLASLNSEHIKSLRSLLASNLKIMRSTSAKASNKLSEYLALHLEATDKEKSGFSDAQEVALGNVDNGFDPVDEQLAELKEKISLFDQLNSVRINELEEQYCGANENEAKKVKAKELVYAEIKSLKDRIKQVEGVDPNKPLEDDLVIYPFSLGELATNHMNLSKELYDVYQENRQEIDDLSKRLEDVAAAKNVEMAAFKTAKNEADKARQAKIDQLKNELKKSHDKYEELYKKQTGLNDKISLLKRRDPAKKGLQEQHRSAGKELALVISEIKRLEEEIGLDDATGAVPAAEIIQPADDSVSSSEGANSMEAAANDYLEKIAGIKKRIRNLQNELLWHREESANTENKQKVRREHVRDATEIESQLEMLKQELEDLGSSMEEESAANAPEKTEAMAETTEEAMVLEQLEEISRMSSEHKKGVIDFIADLGYMSQEMKGNFMGKMFATLNRAKTEEEKKSFLGRYLSAYSKTYYDDAERAKKARENQEKGVISKGTGMISLGGNMMRVGRVLVDAIQTGTARTLNPFRHVTTTALLVGRAAEAGKETRLMNEELIDKNRIKQKEGDKYDPFDENIVRAAAEAEAIYEKAGIAEIKITNPDGTLNEANLKLAKGKMDTAYKEGLPNDLKERLNRIDGVGLKFMEALIYPRVKASVEKLNEKIAKIEALEISPEEKSVKIQRILISNEKFLRDMDRMVADQGMVDTMAYLGKKVEQGGKLTASLMMIDSVYRVYQHLPEIQAWIQDFTHSVVTEAENIGHYLTHGSEVQKPNIATGPRAAGAAELPPKILVKEKDGTTTVQKTGPQQPELGAKGKTPPESSSEMKSDTTFKNRSAGKAPASAGTAKPLESAKTTAGASSAKSLENSKTPSSASAPKTVEAPNASEKEVSEEFKRGKDMADSAIVKKGDGIIRVLKRQIVEDPEAFGYKEGGKETASQYATRIAEKVGSENGYWDKETGREIRLGSSAIGHAGYELEYDQKSGEFKVNEMVQEKPGSDFVIQETHGKQAFEGTDHEKYEYIYGKDGNGESSGGAVNHDNLSGGHHGNATEQLNGNDGGAIRPETINPHTVENPADAEQTARIAAEYKGIVGVDDKGNLLISEAEAAKAGIKLGDGISLEERAKLDFWRGHLDEIKSGDEANGFFSLADKTFSNGSKIEYSNALYKAYQDMPKEIAGYTDRSVGYLKVYGGGSEDRVREGLVELMGMTGHRHATFQLIQRGDGVIIAKDLRIDNKITVDVYFTRDKVGIMQPRSFLGMGRWDYWRGQLGVINGHPVNRINPHTLRELTYNIKNIDALNEQGLHTVSFDEKGGYPGAGRQNTLPPFVDKDELPKGSGATDQTGEAGKVLTDHKTEVLDKQPTTETPNHEAATTAVEKTTTTSVEISPEHQKTLDSVASSPNKLLAVKQLASLDKKEVISYFEQQKLDLSETTKKNIGIGLDKLRDPNVSAREKSGITRALKVYFDRVQALKKIRSGTI